MRPPNTCQCSQRRHLRELQLLQAEASVRAQEQKLPALQVVVKGGDPGVDVIAVHSVRDGHASVEINM